MMLEVISKSMSARKENTNESQSNLKLPIEVLNNIIEAVDANGNIRNRII